MEQNPTLMQNVDTLFSNLENFTQNEGLLGKPVAYGDKTFIPVVSVTLGYGTGNTAGKNSTGTGASQTTTGTGQGSMSGGALGLGAKLNTEAVIVIDKENVSMISMSAAGAATQLIDKIPQMIMGKNQNNQQQNQQQGTNTSGTGTNASSNTTSNTTWKSGSNTGSNTTM